MNEWKDAQDWEMEWWGDCVNTLSEEVKQLEYAKWMGLSVELRGGHLVVTNQVSVLDIGAGPTSLLLKSLSKQRKVALDPLMSRYPHFVNLRYQKAGIETVSVAGEDIIPKNLFENKEFDEVWIYNCLQHTYSPELIIEGAKKVGSRIRIFEWVGLKPMPGHPQELSREKLDKWLGKPGEVVKLNTNLCVGSAYFNDVEV